MFKRAAIYIGIIGVFGCPIGCIIEKGKLIQPPGAAVVAPASMPPERSPQHAEISFGLLLLQVSVILIAAFVFGQLSRFVRQPVVAGEMLAGICLGPSLLGWLWPSGSHWLFPAENVKILMLFSQIGVVFFMFIVGMDLDLLHLKKRTPHAVMISHVSIIFPFFLGVCLAYYIYGHFGSGHNGFLSFALYMGIAMSITAFPVLARIVQERGLSNTPLGTLALTCAAADDVTAWCILAVVVAISKAGSVGSGLRSIGLALIFISAMLWIVKPWLKKRAATVVGGGRRGIVLALILVLLSSWTSESIGIHALFGAFLAGIIMPGDAEFKKALTQRVEGISMLLMPLFFASTGMRTEIGLISQPQLWIVFGLIVLAAVGGKLGGSAITARIMGLGWSESLSIGVLMNTRGLVELVVLNIGYQMGILSPEIFTVMVLMALGTTFMTVPLLNLVYRTDKQSIKKASFQLPL